MSINVYSCLTGKSFDWALAFSTDTHKKWHIKKTNDILCNTLGSINKSSLAPTCRCGCLWSARSCRTTPGCGRPCWGSGRCRRTPRCRRPARAPRPSSSGWSGWRRTPAGSGWSSSPASEQERWSGKRDQKYQHHIDVTAPVLHKSLKRHVRYIYIYINAIK